MALTLAFPYKRGEIISTSPANITFDEEKNGRAFLYSKDDFQDLLDDLESNIPIRTPIWCYKFTKDSEGGNVQGLKLVAGQRRILAGLEYLKSHPDYLMKVLVVDEPKDDRDALEMNISENAGHKGLTIIDQGHDAIRLRGEATMEGGRTMEQIAKILRISQPQVTQAIKLVEGLPEVVQRAIAKGLITADAGLTVLKVEDPEKREGLIEQFLSGKGKDGGVIPIKKDKDKGNGNGEEGSRVDLSSNEKPSEPVGQAERPIPAVAEVTKPEPTLRDAVRDAGGKVAMRMPELKKYLREAIDEKGPGSNLGEVKLKEQLLKFLDGNLKAKTMDEWWNKLCKMKGE